ncbi:hypothetical protein QR680_015100 [Steinernema hermaphroditum]|uniref:Peptidase A1 domain-containing protein n=1 Tax=Steinernema hermaphroditum TaxID=289476 RepID=A0AA39IB76_9BILA|nr:hypothetical protein QR680_015100 [Steinernema hermaphroditum]
MLRCISLAVLLACCLAAPSPVDRRISPVRITRRLPSQLNHYHHDPTDVSLMSLTVSMGSGQQQMPDLEVDLTKGDLEIVFCTDTSAPPAGMANVCYNPKLSSTYVSLSNGTGMDTVKSAFPDDQFNLPNTTFIVKSLGAGNGFLPGGESGIVGFGWPSLQKLPGEFFAYNYLKHYGSKRFSLTMGVDGCEGRHYWGSECLEELAGATPHYVPATTMSNWQFQLNGFTFGTVKQVFHAQGVVTSTKGYIGMPKKFLQQMMNAYKIQWDGLYTSYVVDCNADLPDFNIMIEGKNIKIAAKQYIYKKEPLANGKCIVNFEDSKAYGFGPDWYFGLPLLQAECLTFDYDQKRIGFTTNTEYCSWCHC